MARLEIAVAGAGIGGLVAALFLARAGHRVVVAERFGSPRPVGSGLIIQPTGFSVLEALGLGETVAAPGRSIRRLFGEAGGRTVLDVRYRALGREGLGVHRSALFGAAALGRAFAAIADPTEAAQAYAAARRSHVRLYQAISRFTPVYQSDSRLLPLARDRLAAPLSRLPLVDRLLAKLVSGEIGRG